MTLTDLQSKTGTKKNKRVGRGNASGHGTYSCRGMNGQSARTGGRRRPGFEGGQTPYLRRMPKLKGFTNPNAVTYQPVNVGLLNIFDDNSEVTSKELREKNLISKINEPIKLLAGKGELEKTLTITVDKASLEAIKKVEAKKGKVNILAPKKEKVESKKDAKKREKEEKTAKKDK